MDNKDKEHEILDCSVCGQFLCIELDMETAIAYEQKMIDAATIIESEVAALLRTHSNVQNKLGMIRLIMFRLRVDPNAKDLK